ncbi:lysozyme inhibitor LprI family protein [Methylocystis sp. IM4]|uniref:lysozyme inhibitor LprI family protein n=1 Tax=Methylocystis sp. IM4 TaxID=3136560 RepID=UPI00311A3329
MKYLSYLIVLAIFLTPAFAGDAADPIAAEADKCFKTPQGETTAGMTACSHQAYIAYDKQMNELYRRVMESVDPQSQERIREAQRRWLAYRDAQRRADDGPWRADRGSMASPDIEAMNIDAVRQRIQELRYYAP